MPHNSIDNLPVLSSEARTQLEGAVPLHPRGWVPVEVDAHRAYLLLEAAKNAPSHAPLAEIRDLARRLNCRGNFPRTMASCRYTYEQGLRLSGAFIDLAARYGQPVEFRIYQPGLELPADNLETVEFDYIRDCLRRALARAAEVGADGYVGAVARGEYNVVDDSYRLYFRGLAFGDLADALPYMNELDDYDYAPWQGSYSPPFLRVRWRRIKKRNVTRFTRLVPIDWRRIYEVRYENEWVRQSLWSELPLLRLAQLLLFWDTLNLRDVTLLMGLRAGQEGLRLTAKGRGKRRFQPEYKGGR